MKVNEAPEKIYLQVCGDCQGNECDNCKFEDFEDDVTWCQDKIFDKDIQYTRTDAFIEKACEWLELNLSDRPKENIKFWLEDFKNYMEGE